MTESAVTKNKSSHVAYLIIYDSITELNIQKFIDWALSLWIEI